MQRKNPAVRELNRVSTALKELAGAFQGLGSVLVATVSSNGTSRTGTRQRAKPRLTAAWRRALKLQGAYMGTIRGLKPRQRSQVKQIRAAKGVRAAIAAARRMAN